MVLLVISNVPFLGKASDYIWAMQNTGTPGFVLRLQSIQMGSCMLEYIEHEKF
jgi:hypothetical protein